MLPQAFQHDMHTYDNGGNGNDDGKVNYIAIADNKMPQQMAFPLSSLLFT